MRIVKSKGYISHTQIDTYLRCPRLYKFSYRDGHKRPAGLPLLFGRAIHHTLEQYGRYYAKTGGHNPKMMSGLWSCSCEDPDVISTPLPYDQYQKGRGMLLSLIDGGNFDLSNAIMLEYDFILELAGVNVRGVVDRVDQLAEGVYRVVDYKTGGSIYSGEAVENSLQLAMYAAAIEKTLGDEVRHISVAIHQINQDIFIEREKTLEDIEYAKQYVADINARICADSEMQANPGEACLRYGGCWAAHLCDEHKNVSIEENDLAQASGTELLRFFTHLEMQRKLITAALKGKLESEDKITYGGRVAALESGNKYVYDDLLVGELIDSFDINPRDLGNYDIRKFRKAIVSKREEILASPATEEEKDFFIGKLDELSGKAYEVVPGNPQLKVRKE